MSTLRKMDWYIQASLIKTKCGLIGARWNFGFSVKFLKLNCNLTRGGWRFEYSRGVQKIWFV